MGKAIGIDLGTTNSSVSYLQNGIPVIIPNSRGNNRTPSIVAFTKKNEILVGECAKNQAIINSERTITNIKRLMGSNTTIKIGDKEFLPQVISSFILAKLKEDAEKYLGEPVTDAVITVPAYFTDAQRQATYDAGKLAGLNILRIINEPTAASLAYGLNKQESCNILVYDLGGGTFDVSVLEYDNGIFEVKATKGNNKLGGIDFDKKLCDFVIEKFMKKTKIDLRKDKFAMQKLIDEIEKTKISLSEREEVEVNIPFISADENGPKHLQFDITRSIFEELIIDNVNETIQLTEQAIFEAGISKENIDKIILVGGSSKIPLIKKKIEDFMGKKVICGINPLEAVALGAGIQTGIITGEISGVVLVDVTPLSLGIEIDGGLFVPIIERNSTIPAEAKKVFTTISDNQEEVEINILQGESKFASENISLGKFTLSGIRKAKKGEPRIEVTFEIDINSIVQVTAKDMDTNEFQRISVSSKIGMTQEQLQFFIDDINNYKKRSNYNNEINLIKNKSISCIIKIEKLLKNNIIDHNFKNEIENIIMVLTKAVDENNIELIEKNYKILNNYYEELMEIIKFKNKNELILENVC